MQNTARRFQATFDLAQRLPAEAVVLCRSFPTKELQRKQALSTPKQMTHGEAGLAIIFAVFALFLSLFASAKALDSAFAFHAALTAAFSLGPRSRSSTAITTGRTRCRRREIDGRPNYNLGPIKFAAAISMFWGIAGFLVGVIIACQLAWPALNFDLPWTSFGRLRPLHTSAVIFAFGGNVLIATSFYVVQRTCRARLAGDLAPWFVFWAISSSSCSPAPATCSASPSARNTPSRSGTPICG